ncbi:MAG TPA: 50S ribosomal protein L11, partial [Anaerolineae bacterium]
IPVAITLFTDHSVTFVPKTPPAANLIKQAANVQKGSATPNTAKVASITRKQLRDIAEAKLKDLNAYDVDQAMRMIEGSARSMGITVSD